MSLKKTHKCHIYYFLHLCRKRALPLADQSCISDFPDEKWKMEVWKGHK